MTYQSINNIQEQTSGLPGFYNVRFEVLTAVLLVQFFLDVMAYTC